MFYFCIPIPKYISCPEFFGGADEINSTKVDVVPAYHAIQKVLPPKLTKHHRTSRIALLGKALVP